MKTIKINGTEYNFKYSIRALFLFEQIAGKQFEVKSLLDQYLFLYCIILASNKDNFIEWDEFIDAIDNDQNIYFELTKLVDENDKKNDLFDKDETKKKKTVKK